MSRISVRAKKEVHQVILGLDNQLGEWFFQVYDKDGDDDFPVFNILGTRSNSEMLEAMNEWADITDHYTFQVYKYIGMDLDPGQITKR